MMWIRNALRRLFGEPAPFAPFPDRPDDVLTLQSSPPAPMAAPSSGSSAAVEARRRRADFERGVTRGALMYAVETLVKDNLEITPSSVAVLAAVSNSTVNRYWGTVERHYRKLSRSASMDGKATPGLRRRQSARGNAKRPPDWFAARAPSWTTEWVSGGEQRAIAKREGCSETSVCRAIRDFTDKYCPPSLTGDLKKIVRARAAVDAWRAPPPLPVQEVLPHVGGAGA